MLWMVAVLAAGEIAYEPRVAMPVLEPDASVAAGAMPLRTGFDLAAVRDRDEHRLGALDQTLEADDPRNPLVVSALEDDRQRLTFGVKPGLRRARLGFNYSLSLD